MAKVDHRMSRATFIRDTDERLEKGGEDIGVEFASRSEESSMFGDEGCLVLTATLQDRDFGIQCIER
ncbi:hypothetical protein NMY22_g18885 [Coprinellus aureogranulatus]|nr:hypothetical protein NMY22_g18885 [Coprinellus aureogranulatus]